ncbi:sensor histidine kinase [Fusobacterium sp.]|uniref:sensor histidine kinase n=1 Tax=Fusobacterium sp. TaxID=68766 RepID=UPI0026374B19|nr:sensor histidine kinase [Fusobacterium sp.]MDY3059712.1 sensor histidine kinase [Fusobacterium sp.]MEE1475474.1 sensor histidine kinase [Fusobacterium sp.]
MLFKLISHLFNNLGYIIAIAFFFTKLKRAKDIFTHKKYSKKDVFILSCFFSILAIIGTYTGADYRGAIVNVRNIGVVVGGILAGPEVGILAGFIAGLHRLFIDVDPITTIPCATATMIGGFITAYLYKKCNEKNFYLYGFLGGFLVENLSMLLILVMGKDFELAKDIVSNIYFPMILANAVGVSIVLLIIQDIIEEKDIIAGKQAKLSLEIANKTLPYFRNGESLNEVCKIISDSLGAKAVVITNEKYITASYSTSEDFKIAHTDIKSEVTKKVLKTGKICIIGQCDDVKYFQCVTGKIKSCIISPLFQGDKVSGTLKIYFDTKENVTASNQYLVEGLSLLISTQLELSSVENLKTMAKEAELKALQTQINPHFLFNALHTTSFFVRKDPNKAREIIIDLSTYLRYNLENSCKLVPLEMELEQVKAYFNIEKARFGDKISLNIDVDENIKNISIPSLIIQPLVENSIKHGLLKKREGGFVNIIAKKENKGCLITIEDNGIGIDQKIIDNLDDRIDKNIGLKNVHNRIKLIYGKGLVVEKLETGTKISFYIE